MAAFDVLVVGDSAWDTMVLPERAPRLHHDVPGRVVSGPGGQGFNVARAARLAGAEVALVTQVGRDDDSAALVRSARRLGIALPLLAREDPVSRIVSLVEGTGERALISSAGSGPRAAPARRLSSRFLVLSGYLIGRAGGVAYARSWLSWAEGSGARVWIDVAHPDVAGLWAGIVPRDACLAATSAEWAAYDAASGGRPHPGDAVRKEGPSGASWWRGRQVLHRAPGSRDLQVVDTTGAGDALLGSLVGRLALSEPPARALAEAVRTAEAVCTRLGASPES